MSRTPFDINQLFSGTTRLHWAAAGDSQEQVLDLLNKGADPNARNFEGATPLHRAMDRNRWPDIDKDLIKAGADPNARDNFGATPLHYGAANAGTPRVQTLLEAGANPHAQDNEGRTPLHRGYAAGRAGTARVLIDAGADPNARDNEGRPAMGGKAVPPEHQAEYERAQNRINPPDAEGRTPLHRAAENGSFYAVNDLLKDGADPNVRDAEGIAPLHAAADNLDAPETVQVLIVAGADPNARDADGQTPLHYAVGADQARSVEALIQANANVDSQDKDGQTPLHYASSNRSLTIADRLLEAGADTKLLDRWGRSPLDAIQNLRERLDPDSRADDTNDKTPDIVDSQQQTPLHRAAQANSLEDVNYLLATNANPNAKDSAGRSPLHYAAGNCSLEMTQQLLKAGADPHMRDKEGMTPLDWAKETRDYEGQTEPRATDNQTVKLLETATTQPQKTPDTDQAARDGALLRAAEVEHALAVRVQLTKGADPNAADREGNTALHFAAERRWQVDAVKILTDAGADPNARTSLHGQTPLHYAVRADSVRAIDHLIGGGADPNATDSVGHTPLHEATIDALEPETVQRLIQGGADPNVRDSKDSTPLHSAVQADSPQVVSRLLDGKADPNLQDNHGRTSLHYAASVRSPVIATQLLAAGADPTTKDHDGRTAADLGTYIRDRQTPNDKADETIQLLRAAETKGRQHQPEQTTATRDPNSDTALLRAAERGSALGVRLQINKGANPNAADRDGVTALHYAAGTGESEAVRALLDAKADPSIRDEYKGQTPLQLAVQADSPEAVKLLLDAKADPNVPDFDGGTALHYAAANRSPTIARQLIDGGGDPGRADLQGHTPRDIAHQDAPTRDAMTAPPALEQQRTPAPAQQSPGTSPTDKPQSPASSRTDDQVRQFADEIIEQMKKGAAPWQQPWQPGENRLPENFSTGAKYQGGNTLQLMVKREQRSYADHRWGTYNQIKQEGGQIRKGERGTTILVYRPPKPRDDKDAPSTDRPTGQGEERTGERTGRPMWKRYAVFNVEQADGLKLPDRKGEVIPEWKAQENVEQVIRASGVPIREVPGNKAAYNLERDDIVLPERSQFKDAASFYQTALHEVGHSTGHKDRMNRESIYQGCKDGFGSPAYAREELRAEISAMMSSDRLGVAYQPQHGTAYVASWIKSLEDDPKEIYRAAADAGRISDYVCSAPERARAKSLADGKDAPAGDKPTPERAITRTSPQQTQPSRTPTQPSLEMTR